MHGIVVVLTLGNLLFFTLWWLNRQGNKSMGEQVDRLRSEVSENRSAVDSAIVLINGFANRIRELAMENEGDELTAAVGLLADELDANSNRLAAAVAANTGAADDSDVIDDEGNAIGSTAAESNFDDSSLSIEGQTDAGGEASHTVQTQPQTGLGVEDGNVATNEPGESLNPRFGVSDSVVGDESGEATTGADPENNG